MEATAANILVVDDQVGMREGCRRALTANGFRVTTAEHGAEVELGTPPASPMMVAAWQVHETVKILTGRGELLRGRLLFLDAMSSEARIFDLRT